jgi:hypothetical protein
MGSKQRRSLRRAASTSQKKRFPVGELAAQRSTLRRQYLSKSKELTALKRKLSRLEKKVGKNDK